MRGKGKKKARVLSRALVLVLFCLADSISYDMTLRCYDGGESPSIVMFLRSRLVAYATFKPNAPLRKRASEAIGAAYWIAASVITLITISIHYTYTTVAVASKFNGKASTKIWIPLILIKVVADVTKDFI